MTPFGGLANPSGLYLDFGGDRSQSSLAENVDQTARTGCRSEVDVQTTRSYPSRTRSRTCFASLIVARNSW
ncbi:hypothetical protein PC119_g25841 [Phytophthora cactorum]|uniref:Uncharacterized protein n=1 Tax=Phytophthora cactorum TaxID=29920 RepID=A0A8T0Y4N3_9STRA|nr:hypothetical protein PC113_g23359 [Phytophthora cactorum]KAG2883139.1 hypothetical protein PC117_g26089 [Phytophthora cactorum]KAG2962357.1 hypothetical protein PC119_g25841 [Phytophthora cactorum]KAG2975791.1 hypothetical protein PC120_g25786 [Phytophthora cactorum]KAG3124460.1 hypothetical protein C6341_g26146 [Phytophthora cactorum]